MDFAPSSHSAAIKTGICFCNFTQFPMGNSRHFLKSRDKPIFSFSRREQHRCGLATLAFPQLWLPFASPKIILKWSSSGNCFFFGRSSQQTTFASLQAAKLFILASKIMNILKLAARASLPPSHHIIRRHWLPRGFNLTIHSQKRRSNGPCNCFKTRPSG
jgi:hypothetical protein